MVGACKAAKIPHYYHPHDLRHRRASLWLAEGVSVKEVQERGGWKRAAVLLDVYSHVMPPVEIPTEDYRALLVRSR